MAGIVVTSFVPVPVSGPAIAPVAGEGGASGFRDVLDARLLSLTSEAPLAREARAPASTPPESDQAEPGTEATAPAGPPVASAAPPPQLVVIPTPAPVAQADPAVRERAVPGTHVPSATPPPGVAGAAISPFVAPDAAVIDTRAAPGDAGALTSALPLPGSATHERRSEGETRPVDGAPPAHISPTAPHAPPHDTKASFTIDAPVGAPGWADAVAERVVLVARDAGGSAELHVQPAELGPVSVRIDVRGDQATVVFGASHADTRSALEAALPRLVESLAAQGLALAHAHVGAQLARDGGHPSSAPGRSGGPSAPGEIPPLAGTGETARVRVGLVDVFA